MLEEMQQNTSLHTQRVSLSEGSDRQLQHLKERRPRLHPDEVTYNTLLDGCARYGLFDRGLDRFSPNRFAFRLLSQ